MDHLARLWLRRALCLVTLLAECADRGQHQTRGTHAADVRTITEEVLGCAT